VPVVVTKIYSVEVMYTDHTLKSYDWQ